MLSTTAGTIVNVPTAPRKADRKPAHLCRPHSVVPCPKTPPASAVHPTHHVIITPHWVAGSFCGHTAGAWILPVQLGAYRVHTQGQSEREGDIHHGGWGRGAAGRMATRADLELGLGDGVGGFPTGRLEALCRTIAACAVCSAALKPSGPRYATAHPPHGHGSNWHASPTRLMRCSDVRASAMKCYF